jgi:hypothetical protein
MVAARDRARRLQALLGPQTPVLMGQSLVVLIEPPRETVAAAPADAANEPAAEPVPEPATARDGGR